MVVVSMVDEGIVRMAGGKKGGAGTGIASMMGGDAGCYRFGLHSEDEAENFALRKNEWAGHVLDRAYAPAVPEYVKGDTVEVVPGFFVHVWGHGLRTVHFDALRAGPGGPRRTIVGRLDCDGTLYLAGELPDRKGFVGFAFNLRSDSPEIECFEFIPTEQDAWTFAVDRRRPEVVRQIARPVKGTALAACYLDLEMDCVRFSEER